MSTKDTCGPVDSDLVKKAQERPKEMSDEDWRTILSPKQYDVARGHGTERAWTGEYNDFKEKGMFKCVCCGVDLFPSEVKFDSGSGWPSFYDTHKEGKEDNVKRIVDKSFGMVRTEVRCAKCDGHLGHVFDDGPGPTGLRYCINSASMDFQKY